MKKETKDFIILNIKCVLFVEVAILIIYGFSYLNGVYG